MRGRQYALERWRDSAVAKTLFEPKLTTTEQEVFDELRADGWYVLRNGWPDFLAVRDGKVRFIEVKSAGNSLRAEQRRLHRELRKLGIEVEIIRRTVGTTLIGRVVDG